MTLPVFPNPISLNQVNVELSIVGTTLISLNQANVRTLAGVPSGAISMNNLHGKSARAQIVVNLASSTANLDYIVNSILGYSFGNTDFILNINAGVYAYATGVGFPAVYIRGTASGDTVTINNSGYIIGAGGAGGDCYAGAGGTSGSAGQVGLIFSLAAGVTTTINNAAGAYIAGGGGGGAGWDYSSGGGGAGGGDGGDVYTGAGSLLATGGAGGGPGLSGVTGNFASYSIAGRSTLWAGGGGGRVVPGSTTNPSNSAPPYFNSYSGLGGTAGGVGGGDTDTGDNGGYGGGPGQAGEAMSQSAGGGGGWGAAGGSVGGASGGAAGAAINRQGATVTVNNSGSIYGATI
jgi:hypothetical protein